MLDLCTSGSESSAVYGSKENDFLSPKTRHPNFENYYEKSNGEGTNKRYIQPSETHRVPPMSS